MPNSEEILEGVKELEKMSSNIIPSFTFLQKKIRENGGCPKLSQGLSRISDYFIKNHENFFYK